MDSSLMKKKLEFREDLTQIFKQVKRFLILDGTYLPMELNTMELIHIKNHIKNTVLLSLLNTTRHQLV